MDLNSRKKYLYELTCITQKISSSTIEQVQGSQRTKVSVPLPKNQKQLRECPIIWKLLAWVGTDSGTISIHIKRELVKLWVKYTV